MRKFFVNGILVLTLNSTITYRLEFNLITFFEHGGTHLDAPAHFAEGRPRLHAVPAEQLIAPGVMIDVSEKVCNIDGHRENIHGDNTCTAVS